MELKPQPIYFPYLVRESGTYRTEIKLENPYNVPALIWVESFERPDWLALERWFEPSREDREFDGEKKKARWEAIGPGQLLLIKPKGSIYLQASADTGHQRFPEGKYAEDSVYLRFWRNAFERPADRHALEGQLAEFEKELAEKLPRAPKVERLPITFDPGLYDEGYRVYGDEGLDVDEQTIAVTLARLVDRENYIGVFAIDFGTTNTCFAHKSWASSDPEEADRPARSSEQLPSLIFFTGTDDAERPAYEVGKHAKEEINKHFDQFYSYFLSVKRDLGRERFLFAMDEKGGADPSHIQRWPAEKVATFYLESVIKQAEEEMGKRITNIVATFPTLFPPARQKAIQEAFVAALQRTNPGAVEGKSADEVVKIRLDEANAATFGYVAGDLLGRFFKFPKERDEHYVLTFDFGGGTIDICFLKAAFSRDMQVNKTTMATRLLGVSGEPNFGGDNVTLELFRILKTKVAVAAARLLVEKADKAKSQAAAAPKVEEKPSMFGSMFQLPAMGALLTGLPGGGGGGGADDERLERARTIVKHADLLVEAARRGAFVEPTGERDPFIEAVRLVEQERARAEGRAPDLEGATAAADEIERLLPTRWSKAPKGKVPIGSFAPGVDSRERTQDAPGEDASRKARDHFYELWFEAERSKIRLVKKQGPDTVESELKKIAAHLGVEAKDLGEGVTVTPEDLDTAIDGRLGEAIAKARALVLKALEEEREARMAEAKPGLLPPVGTVTGKKPIFGEWNPGGAGAEAPVEAAPLPTIKILLAGNSSRLPAVRRTFSKVFADLQYDFVEWEPERLKTGVAQGAVEEEFLRKTIGEKGGFITFETEDFLRRLPYSVGLYYKAVGFKKVFSRGAPEMARNVLDSATNELVHRGMDRLPLYADYHDGSGRKFLGFFDCKKPLKEGKTAQVVVSTRHLTKPGEAAAKCVPVWEKAPFSQRNPYMWQRWLPAPEHTHLVLVTDAKRGEGVTIDRALPFFGECSPLLYLDRNGHFMPENDERLFALMRFRHLADTGATLREFRQILELLWEWPEEEVSRLERRSALWKKVQDVYLRAGEEVNWLLTSLVKEFLWEPVTLRPSRAIYNREAASDRAVDEAGPGFEKLRERLRRAADPAGTEHAVFGELRDLLRDVLPKPVDAENPQDWADCMAEYFWRGEDMLAWQRKSMGVEQIMASIGKAPTREDGTMAPEPLKQVIDTYMRTIERASLAFPLAHGHIMRGWKLLPGDLPPERQPAPTGTWWRDAIECPRERWPEERKRCLNAMLQEAQAKGDMNTVIAIQENLKDEFYVENFTRHEHEVIYRLEVRLGENRVPFARELESGKEFRLHEAEEYIDWREEPFLGCH